MKDVPKLVWRPNEVCFRLEFEGSARGMEVRQLIVDVASYQEGVGCFENGTPPIYKWNIDPATAEGGRKVRRVNVLADNRPMVLLANNRAACVALGELIQELRRGVRSCAKVDVGPAVEVLFGDYKTKMPGLTVTNEEVELPAELLALRATDDESFDPEQTTESEPGK